MHGMSLCIAYAHATLTSHTEAPQSASPSLDTCSTWAAVISGSLQAPPLGYVPCTIATANKPVIACTMICSTRLQTLCGYAARHPFHVLSCMRRVAWRWQQLTVTTGALTYAFAAVLSSQVLSGSALRSKASAPATAPPQNATGSYFRHATDRLPCCCSPAHTERISTWREVYMLLLMLLLTLIALFKTGSAVRSPRQACTVDRLSLL